MIDSTWQIHNNLDKLKKEINKVCAEFGRDTNLIKIVAVSKLKPVSAIEAAYQCGQKDFGENYIQEWLLKTQQCEHLSDIKWHIIGHIQKNKIKYLNQSKHKICVQTIDSLEIVKEFEKKITKNLPLDIFIQIKLDTMSSEKHGCDEKSAQRIIEYLNFSKKMGLVGFMAVGIQTNNSDEIELSFQKFVKLSKHLWTLYLASDKSNAPQISLGMSDDFLFAIKDGSTMIRMGSFIFGSR